MIYNYIQLQVFTALIIIVLFANPVSITHLYFRRGEMGDGANA